MNFPLLLLPLSSVLLVLVTWTHALPLQDASITWRSCEDYVNRDALLPVVCANISVPLDYTDPNNNATHTLELIKVAAGTKSPKGSIILNFGSPPGADGLHTLASAATVYQNLTGGQHDLISFNPRGTSKHFMRFSCYENDHDRLLANTPNPFYQYPDASDAALGQLWAAGKVFADACYEKQKSIGGLIGTAFVARDIMQLVDRVGQGPLLNYYGRVTLTNTIPSADLQCRYIVRYSSRSDRRCNVSRPHCSMVLDGVLNPHEYFNSFADFQMSTDIDGAFLAFLTSCVQAGPSHCPLAELNQTASQLQSTMYHVFDTINTAPKTLPAAQVQYDALFMQSQVDYSSLKALCLSTLYHPFNFPYMAAGLHGLLTGNLTAVGARRNQEESIFSDATEAEAIEGIRCSDKHTRATSIAEIMPTVEEVESTSVIGGFTFTMQCARWRMDAKERYTGDFRVTTNFPVLLVGNTWDPVTPLASAKNVSSGFAGSVVLERGGFGHTSGIEKSTCAHEAIGNYFSYHTVPKPGTK